MSICYAGARNNSKLQLEKVLNYDGSFSSNDEFHEQNSKLRKCLFENISKNCKLIIGNKIFHDTSISLNEYYLEQLKKFYAGEAKQINFKDAQNSVKIINNWVAKNTNQKIKRLLFESDIEDIKLLLINTVYFDCKWSENFEKENTYKEEFYLSDGTKMDVSMMHEKESKFNYSYEPNDLPLASCTLPYSGDKISMTIILPHEGQNLSDIESKIDANVYKTIIKVQKEKSVNLYVPRFKFENLSDVISN